ncbi:hypothetical protein WJX72_007443 [[Myrmecia] bisecta]|uniref:Guanine nucleotide-binding protein subunit beta-like protein n=1 Tax=[Myrmecia] bisecta TaxID=41462 RepID=A0AAW1Q5J7_9CHLO
MVHLVAVFACLLIIGISTVTAATPPFTRKILQAPALQAQQTSPYEELNTTALTLTLTSQFSTGVDPINVMAAGFTAAFAKGRDHSFALATAWVQAISGTPEPTRTTYSNVYAQAVIFSFSQNTTAAAEAMVAIGQQGATYTPVVSNALFWAFQNSLSFQAAEAVALGIKITAAGPGCSAFDLDRVYSDIIVSAVNSGLRNVSDPAIVAGYSYGCGTANTVSRSLLEVLANAATSGQCGCAVITPALSSAYAYAAAGGNAVQVFQATTLRSGALTNCLQPVLAAQANATVTAVAGANATATITSIISAAVNSSASAYAAATVITNYINSQGCTPFIQTVLTNISATATAAASASTSTTTIGGVTTTNAAATASALAAIVVSSQQIIGCLQPQPTPPPIIFVPIPPAPPAPIAPVTTTSTSAVAVATVTINALQQRNSNACVTNIVQSVTSTATASVVVTVVEQYIITNGCTQFIQTTIIRAAAAAGATASVTTNGNFVSTSASASASTSVFIQTYGSSQVIKGCVVPTAPSPPPSPSPPSSPTPVPVDYAAQLRTALAARNGAAASSVIISSVTAGLPPTLTTLSVIQSYLQTPGCDGTCFDALTSASTTIASNRPSATRHLLQTSTQDLFSTTYLTTPSVIDCLKSRGPAVAPGLAPSGLIVVRPPTAASPAAAVSPTAGGAVRPPTAASPAAAVSPTSGGQPTFTTAQPVSQPQPIQPREAILCQRVKAHTSAVTASLVLSDGGHLKELITTSLDKTMALWRLQESEDDTPCSCADIEEVVRLTPNGSPIFSLVQDGLALGDTHRQVFCGNHSKEILAWEPPSGDMVEKVVLNGHTGWVRALATHGRWLFSSGCNHLRQWDMSRAVPTLKRDIKVVKGDIQGLATGSNRVFTCGSDGSLRAWEITKKGDLMEAGARDKAHKDRVTAVLFHNNFLYSVSYDGSVKMWDASTLELVMQVANAHDGEKIQCAAIGPDGFLYTGGDDKLVRRWRLGMLTPPTSSALFCHHYSVRALAAGPYETLVSGDAGGEVALWKV